MKVVFASAAGGWQRRVLDKQRAPHRLESFYYAKEKSFDTMFQQIAERNDNHSRGGLKYTEVAQVASEYGREKLADELLATQRRCGFRTTTDRQGEER